MKRHVVKNNVGSLILFNHVPLSGWSLEDVASTTDSEGQAGQRRIFLFYKFDQSNWTLTLFILHLNLMTTYLISQSVCSD